MTTLHRICSALLGLCLILSPAQASGEDTVAPRPEWPNEVLAQFASLPVQDGGRIKPLDTYAGFRLLRMNGKRKVVLPWDDSKKLGPTAWMLDCLFYPEIARTYRIFYVRDSDVLNAVDLHFEGRKRTDRYSYEELLPAREKLLAAYGNYDQMEPAARDRIESQTVALVENMLEFEHLSGALDFARRTFRVDGSAGLQQLFEDATEVSYSHLLAQGAGIAELAQASSEPDTADRAAVLALFDELSQQAERAAHSLVWFAPEVGVDFQKEWASAPELAFPAVLGTQPVGQQLAALKQLERLVEVRDQPQLFREGSIALHQMLTALATARGEYGKIPLEVRFYRLDLFTKALAFFLLAFVASALTWLGLRGGVLSGVQWGGLSIATVLLTAGIVLRCIIRGRPPVSTLYETILFITAVVALAAIVTELINRQRIALAMAPLLGAAGMFLAMKYELKEAATVGDTMPSLVAVLDTNFWLATHVTTVTIGYAAGLLAAGLAHVWLLGRIFGLKRGQAAFYKGIARMTYGVQCFGLIFAIVGTILGGIWANYSWGRFWGWDPKENGALLIVLWMLILLHGRMGGYLRDFGFQVGSIIGGMVVAFSWWGVNFLGIGLHSYGFTEGVLGALKTSWMIESGVLLLSFAWWLISGRNQLRSQAGAAQAVGQSPDLIPQG